MRRARSWLTSVSILALTLTCRGSAVLESTEPLQLTQNDYISSLEGLGPDQDVLMEFYAHWCADVPAVLTHRALKPGSSTQRVFRCPVCLHFQPTYNKIAGFFHDKPHPMPRVVVARVDCAKEVGAD